MNEILSYFGIDKILAKGDSTPDEEQEKNQFLTSSVFLNSLHFTFISVELEKRIKVIKCKLD